MKEFRNPQDIHEPMGSYVHQIEIKGNERMLVISGQVGMREDGTVPEDPTLNSLVSLSKTYFATSAPRTWM